MRLECFTDERRREYMEAVQAACRGLPYGGHPDDPEQDWETVAARVICEHMDRYYAYIETTGRVRWVTEEFISGSFQVYMHDKPERDFISTAHMPHFNVWLQEGRNLKKKPITMALQKLLWLSHSVVGRYKCEALCPPGMKGLDADGNVPAGVFNLYTRPGVTREECAHVNLHKSKHWKMFKRHLKENMTRNNEELYNYVMSWAASLVQRPGHKMRSAVFFTGEEGAGKSSLFDALFKIIGQAYCASPVKKDILGDTAAILLQKILITVNENSFGKATSDDIARLRTLITDPMQTIRRLWGEPKDYQLFCNFAGTTNFERIINTHKNARRYAFCKTSNTLLEWKKEGGAEWKLWLDTFTTQEGIHAIAKGLYEWDLTDFDDTKIPMDTEDTKEQIRLSLPPIQQFIYEQFELFDTETGSDFFGKDFLKEELLDRCHNSSVFKNPKITKPSLQKLIRELNKILTLTEKRPTRNKKRVRCIHIPGIYEAAEMFEKNIGCDPLPDLDWHDDDEKSDDETGYDSADSSADSSEDESADESDED